MGGQRLVIAKGDIPYYNDRQYIHQRWKSLDVAVDVLFDDLVKAGLIDPDSSLYSTSRERIYRTCFRHLYPLEEVTNNLVEAVCDLLWDNCNLFTLVFFLDTSLDSLENNPSTRIRASQIYAYLLFRYYERLVKRYDKHILRLFLRYYRDQTNYLILEKKWHTPQLYSCVYGSGSKIYNKEIILFFPLELYRRVFHVPQYLILRKLLINYYSAILLADDLLDLGDDINQRCLTYPIIMYFKIKGELPKSQKDISPIIPRLAMTFRKFCGNIERLGVHSVVLDNTLVALKDNLNDIGIKI